jgi:hypothetical protein
MKRKVLLAVIGLGFLVFPVSVFAKGKKEATTEVTVVNRTGAEISQVIITDKGNNNVKTFEMTIQKNSSGTIKIKKDSDYDIVLLDNKGHKYGKEGCKTKSDSDRVEINSKDFISQGLWDTIKKLLGL